MVILIGFYCSCQKGLKLIREASGHFATVRSGVSKGLVTVDPHLNVCLSPLLSYIGLYYLSFKYPLLRVSTGADLS